MKVCTKCGEARPLADYYKQRGGLTARCRHCLLEVAKEYGSRPEVLARRRVQNRGRKRGRTPEQEREYRLRGYGLSMASYCSMLASQGGACAICRIGTPGGAGSWHVDHDHACCPTAKACGGCIRGLLCSRCNQALGLLRDDPAIVRAAARYLEYPALMQALGASL